MHGAAVIDSYVTAVENISKVKRKDSNNILKGSFSLFAFNLEELLPVANPSTDGGKKGKNF